ncbi:MAG TPA: hypothetical protein VH329_01765, partial [Solirubrobacterales bacterium]
VAGIGGVALFIFFFFDWYGTLNGFRASAAGWDVIVDLPGFLIALAGVSGVALACLAAAGQRLNIPVQRGAVTAGLGSLAVLLILWRMVAGSPTLKIGIFLALAAAVAIAAGAVLTLAEEGFRPLVAVSSGKTTSVAAASAPATKTKPLPKKGTTKKSTTKKSAAKKTPAKKSSQKKSPAKKAAAKKK